MSIDHLRDLPPSFFRLNNLRKFGLSDNEIQRVSRVDRVNKFYKFNKFYLFTGLSDNEIQRLSTVDRVNIGCSVLSIHWLHQLCQKIPVAVVAPVALQLGPYPRHFF